MLKRRDFSGGPVVETPPSNARGSESIPDLETKVPHATVYHQNFLKKREKGKDLEELSGVMEMFYILLGKGYMSVYIDQNSLNCKLKMVVFYHIQNYASMKLTL